MMMLVGGLEPGLGCVVGFELIAVCGGVLGLLFDFGDVYFWRCGGIMLRTALWCLYLSVLVRC